MFYVCITCTSIVIQKKNPISLYPATAERQNGNFFEQEKLSLLFQIAG